MEKQNSPRVFLKDKKVIGYTGDMEREVLGYNWNFTELKRGKVPLMEQIVIIC